MEFTVCACAELANCVQHMRLGMWWSRYTPPSLMNAFVFRPGQLYKRDKEIGGYLGLLLRRIRQIKMSAAGCQEDSSTVAYERAVTVLNGLQTNAAVLEQIRQSGVRRPKEMAQMYSFLKRTNLKAEDLDRLNAIHITGTKGKGSVCAMCESILRSHGLKTGFYSSPHLLEVRERIRLDGKPLSKSKFVSYFWECYNMLDATKDQFEGKMPSYFRFLTVMAFHVFLKEKVDVAVVEVGIGGTYDSTNIIPNPVVCGITSLGYDHTDILGDTLEQIAWQKGGICKPGHPAFTVPQNLGPLHTLADRARELNAESLMVVPDLKDYPGEGPTLGLAGEHQLKNASLSSQLCRAWLQIRGRWSVSNGVPEEHQPKTLHGVPVAEPFHFPPEFREGLLQCRWPGRNQKIQREGVTYFLDGGHTPDSLRACANWFKVAAAEEARLISGSVVRVLLFNITGRRNTKVLMEPLLSCGFHGVAFSPNLTSSHRSNSADQTNLTVTLDCQRARTEANKQAWLELQSVPHNQLGGHVTSGYDRGTNQDTDLDPSRAPMKEENMATFDCLSRALRWCSAERDLSLPPPSPETKMSSDNPPHLVEVSEASHVQVLVTGSLHLVGAAMNILGCSVDEL